MKEPLAEIRFMAPAAWRDELQEIAETQAISLSDLLRLIVRGFMRNRYTLDQREALR